MITWPTLAEALRLCATRSATAVHVVGRPGGVIRLRADAVVGTWTTGTPLALPSPDPATRSPAAATGPLARLAMTDAVFVMAAGHVSVWRTEDEPAPRPGPDGAPAGVPMDLEALLHEVDRRMRRVAGPDGLLPPEETAVRRLDRPGGPKPLAPTGEESRLLEALGAPGAATGPTVRDLAFTLGRGVFAVLLDVQRLAAMGAVALTARGVEPGPPPVLLVQARRDLDGPSVAALSAALRRRRVELSGAEHAAAEPPAALARRVPGATGAERTRRRVPWAPRRPPHQRPDQTDGQR